MVRKCDCVTNVKPSMDTNDIEVIIGWVFSHICQFTRHRVPDPEVPCGFAEFGYFL